MPNERLFFRIIFTASLILLIGILISGIGKILAFFNEGGSRATLLNVPKIIQGEYNPKIFWLPDQNPDSREMEAYNREIIAESYVKALYQRNIALLSSQTNGVKEHYCVTTRPKIFEQISFQKKRGGHIEKAELSHTLEVLFYAADGQMVVFNDYNVDNRSRYYNKENLRLFSNQETSDYKVIMILEDGFWKIKSIEKLAKKAIESPTNDTTKLALSKDSLIEELRSQRGINYYPKKTPWKDFWIKYDSAIIENDFAKIKALNLNSVRIFINYEQFGKGDVIPEMLTKLDHLMETAKKNNLKVLLTLFDFNSNYQLLNFPSTDRQLETLLKRYRANEALLAWDLKNEADLDYYYQDKKDVQEWLRLMVKNAKIYDPYHPITIGWAYPENAEFLSKELDFISFHYYKDPKFLKDEYDKLKIIAQNKPIVLEEFGLSNYQSLIFPLGKSKNDQAKYLQDVLRVIGNKSFYYWTLYDFENVSGEIAGNRIWQRNAQKYFGLLDINGKPKPIVKVLNHHNDAIKTEFYDFIQPYMLSYSLIILTFVLIYLNRKKILTKKNHAKT